MENRPFCGDPPNGLLVHFLPKAGWWWSFCGLPKAERLGNESECVACINPAMELSLAHPTTAPRLYTELRHGKRPAQRPDDGPWPVLWVVHLVLIANLSVTVGSLISFRIACIRTLRTYYSPRLGSIRGHCHIPPSSHRRRRRPLPVLEHLNRTIIPNSSRLPRSSAYIIFAYTGNLTSNEYLEHLSHPFQVSGP